LKKKYYYIIIYGMRQKMLKVKIFLLVILLSNAVPGSALDPNKTIEEYVHEVWRVEDGLPHQSVRCLLQSTDGYIWVGTVEGLARFDGVRFTIFNKSNTVEIKNNNITALYEDSRGDIWIGTSGGLNRLKDGKFSSYTTRDGLSHDEVLSICGDKNNNTWIGTAGGLNCLKDGIFTIYTIKDGLLSNRVSALDMDRKGNLWIGTSIGLNRLQDGKITGYTAKDGLYGSVITYIYADPAGNLWIATMEGLNRLRDGKFSVYPAQDGLSNNYVSAIYEDRSGSLWIAAHRGLNRLRNGIFTTFSEKNSPLNNMAFSSFIEDKEGSFWLGSLDGLSRLKDRAFTIINTKDGLSGDIIYSVMEDRGGSYWICTGASGLNRWKDGEVTIYTTKDGLSSNNLSIAFEDREGALWIGTLGGGVSRFKDGIFKVYTTANGLSHNTVLAIMEDREGSLWFGTYGGGLDRLKNGKFEVFNIKSGLSNNIVRTIYEDSKGTLWIGTSGGGLNRFKDGTFTAYTMKEGLSSNRIRPIYEDKDGVLWIGTYGGGLIRLKDGKFTNYTTEVGLFNDIVHQILEDDGGNLWMSCNNGIFRVKKNDLNDFAEARINSVKCVSYGTFDGMKSSECNGISQPPGFKNCDGKLWFPTMNGVAVIDPSSIKMNPLPPPVKIEEFLVNDKALDLNNWDHRLSPGKKKLEFYYTALSFLVPQRVKLKYRLEGFEKKWNVTGMSRTAKYSNPSPGYYTFKVIACNNDGIWNNEGASIRFYLQPFFYQTWWFKLLGGLLVFLIIFGVYRIRVRQLHKKKLELEKLVDKRTTQLKESNKQLADANKELERLSLVASETDNAVAIMDHQGNIEWINEGFTRMFEESFAQFIAERGKNIIETSSNPDIKNVMNRCINEKKAVTYETCYTTRTGREIWSQTTLTPILDQDQNVKRIIAIDSDITKIKKAEETAEMERRIAQRANQSKSEFLARMSHEIRTPMNAIVGFTDLLLDTELNDQQLEFTRTINRSVEALITLLNDILDFSKIEAGELTFDPIDFDPEVTAFDICELVSPRIGTKDIELLCRIGDNVPTFIKSDPGRFRQVILNLMGNAAKFTEEGEIELSLYVESKKDGRIKMHVKVRDTGIGVPEDKVDKIFEVFQQADGSTTRKFGGTGLGLSICKQIARLMGGDVWVESKEGIGSIFHFTCWVEKSKKKPVRKMIYDSLKGKRVLIVDDNATNLEILSHILEKAGMQVIKLLNSTEFIPTITRYFENNENIDIGIIDIRMPELDGFKLAREIRKLNPPMSELKLLAFSSSSLSFARIFKDAGFNGFLSKPVRRWKLLKMLVHLLSSDMVQDEEKPDEMLTQHTITEESKHRINILLAEDNPINLKLAVFLLEKAGYLVRAAKNGEEAIEIFTAEPGKYDLILMDIQMPNLDGREATKIIREKGFKDIPIIAMTAEAMKGDREKCIEAGMNDYIRKPIKRDVVFKMITKWCFDR
jgi:two-component system sensor histidine kinase/response regulator